MPGDDVSPPLPRHLGGYELVRLIARGGMADIYLARESGALERNVAIKVLNSERVGDPDACALFLDEARLLAMLSHNNLAGVHEVASANGVHFLAMEYVHGRDLREVLLAAGKANRAVPFEVCVAVVTSAAAGLDHAHRRCAPDGRPLHLVHRDVSLSNIMVGHDGAVKVVDFGIATATVSSHCTNPGVVRGKASYMSPEQCLGDPVDLRTDVFALGVVLYELATGRRCFSGTTDFERMFAVVQGDFMAPSAIASDFPRGLEAVIRTALANDPARRYPSCAAMLDALERLAGAEGWRTGPSVLARFMQELFGSVAEPTPVAEAERHALSCEPTAIICKRRIAHGTEGDPCVEATPEPAPEPDDEPTRGRRSVPKLLARPVDVAEWNDRAA